LFQTRIQIRNKFIGIDEPPYIIAEMACAHDGDFNKAKELIDLAAEAGVDAIQLQPFSLTHQVAPHHHLYELLKHLEFSPDDWGKLFVYAKDKHEMAVFAFAYDIVSMKLALKFCIDGIKISSADLSNPEMLEEAARSDLPITLGTGASTIEEVKEALNYIQNRGGRKVILMHGIQNFPTPIDSAHIRGIKILQERFNCLVGYADHTEGSSPLSRVIDLVALGMGAVIIEKHITLDRSKKGTDYQSALDPNEFKSFVKTIRDASYALGPSKSQPLKENDFRYRKFQKKSIVAACSLPEGMEITRDKVQFLRTLSTEGISPIEFTNILGKKVSRNIKKYETINYKDLI